MKKNNFFLNPATIITLAILAGVILFWKQIQGLVTGLLKPVNTVTGGLNDVLNNVGLGTSDTKEQVIKESSNKDSPWTPAFYKNAPSGAHLIKMETAKHLASEIYDSRGYLTDNFSRAFAAIKQCSYKSQLSFLVEVFNTQYGFDLLDWVSSHPYYHDFRFSFEDAESRQILNYVNSLPNY